MYYYYRAAETDGKADHGTIGRARPGWWGFSHKTHRKLKLAIASGRQAPIGHAREHNAQFNWVVMAIT